MLKNKKRENFIEETKTHWAPYYGYELTNSDAVEIIDNTSEFFNILIEWKKAQKEQKEMQQ